jgi:hypothetical protein
MPFISTDTVKAKRQAIRKAFPEYNISVIGANYTSIRAFIKSGPIAMLDEGVTDEQVNKYRIEEFYKDKPEVMRVLLGIQAIMDEGNCTESHDSDYGSIPLYYTDLTIGYWDEPYVIKVK